MNTPPTLEPIDSDKLLDALLCRNASHKTFRKGIRNYLIGRLMLDAGLRVGEVVALEMSDLYFAGRPVTSIVVRAEISKSKSERSVPVNEKLRAALEEYLKEHGWLFEHNVDGFAFALWMRRGHITTRQVERIINTAAMKVLGRPVNPHMLRHTFGSRLMRVTNARTVQELLGHENLSSTQIYMHPNEEDKRNAVEKMSEHTRCGHPQHFGLVSCPDLTNNLDTSNADRHV